MMKYSCNLYTKRKILLIGLLHSMLLWSSVQAQKNGVVQWQGDQPMLMEKGASSFVKLPLSCLQKEFPYKTGIVFSNEQMAVAPKQYHPVFYGCFDWHSSVHGHWVMVTLLKQFPQIPEAKRIRALLHQQFTSEKIDKEKALFQGDNASFERIYGWAWLLQLQRELLLWKEDADAQKWATHLQPLADHFSLAWQKFLPKLVYPIRVGEHTNLAFGLSLSWDYAQQAKDTALQAAIRQAALRFYQNDQQAPIAYEPGGYDFLSPGLEEARLMSRLLSTREFEVWLRQFMPTLFQDQAEVFKVAKVLDRTDGKLVHLDGLNLSRAWCFQEILQALPPGHPLTSKLNHLRKIHLEAGLPTIASGDYAGEHWLASFAVYALQSRR